MLHVSEAISQVRQKLQYALFIFQLQCSKYGIDMVVCPGLEEWDNEI